MRNLFSYDNKFMQMLMTIGDMIILNVLFLATVLPLPIISLSLFAKDLGPVTMIMLAISLFPLGGAQAGLYTAAKVQADKEDDSSLVAAYFRGLRSGFSKIAIANTLILMLILVTITSTFNITAISALENGGKVESINFPLIICFMGLFFTITFQSILVLFHSRFNCTVLQLFRNTALVFLLHPLRAIAISLLTWLPLLIFMLNMSFFLMATPIFLALYFAVAHLFAYAFMRKPLEFMISKHYQKLGVPNPDEATPDTDSQEV